MKKTTMWAAILSSLTVLPLAAEPAVTPLRQIAITFDDLPFGGRDPGVARMRAANDAILAAGQREAVPLVGFVNERKLYAIGEMDARTAILESWLDSGAELGNHTFSHPSLQVTPLADFEEEVVRGETVTRLLLDAKGQKLRWFRHPYLRTGPTLEVKAAFESFLAGRGYTVAPVTVENSDYAFSAAYSVARTAGDAETQKRLGAAYLRFTEDQLDFWDQAATRVAGHPIRHVLLLHANEINADYFDDVLALLKRRGFRFVSLDEALKDEAYRLPDRHVGQAGVSWPYRWAKAQGVEIDWRQEPEPPAWVQELYEAATRPTSPARPGT